MSIMLLGKSGYLGTRFSKEIHERGISGECISRKDWDYTDEDTIREQLNVLSPEVLICAAAFIPTPSVDLCKDNPAETWRANVHLPVMLARVCQELGITFCHISTACLYDDKREYSEDDIPTRLGDGYCSLYLNTKFFAETLVRDICEKHYIWRIRLPFDEIESPRNYLSKLKSYSVVWGQTNSLTHRGDFARSALDMIERKVPFGTYHMVNKGATSSRAIVDMMKDKIIQPLYDRGLAGGSILSTAKLEATGCGMRAVQEAIQEALMKWRKE
jgi:dTDP-4-dehydrorhamnose reductase